MHPAPSLEFWTLHEVVELDAPATSGEGLGLQPVPEGENGKVHPTVPVGALPALPFTVAVNPKFVPSGCGDNTEPATVSVGTERSLVL